jgi:hypothetical protein
MQGEIGLLTDLAAGLAHISPWLWVSLTAQAPKKLVQANPTLATRSIIIMALGKIQEFVFNERYMEKVATEESCSLDELILTFYNS